MTQASYEISNLTAGTSYFVQARMIREEGDDVYESMPFEKDFETKPDSKFPIASIGRILNLLNSVNVLRSH